MPDSIKRIFARMVASSGDDAFISAVCAMCPDDMEESDWDFKVAAFKENFKELFGVDWDVVDPY